LDARNHGDSPHADEMSLELMCSDLVSFLNEYGIARCNLIGHSMGGRTAMFTALHFSKLIESLVVVDISPAPTPTPSNCPCVQLYVDKYMCIRTLVILLSIEIIVIKSRVGSKFPIVCVI